MKYVISELCIDVKDRSCVETCPVECIYEGERSLYINAEECIECGACEPACPTGAVFYDLDLPEEYAEARESTRAFFYDVLPGHTEPLGDPGGSRKVGPVGADSPFVAGAPECD